MPGQVIDAAARSLHTDACWDNPMVGWIVMDDLPEYPSKVIARLVTAMPTPYLLVADTRTGIHEPPPPGLVHMEREPADPPEVGECGAPSSGGVCSILGCSPRDALRASCT